MAAWRGNPDVVKMLLKYGADLNIRGGNSGTALIACIWNRYNTYGKGLKLVKLLLKHGAHPVVDWDWTSNLYGLKFEAHDSPENDGWESVLTKDLREVMASSIRSYEYDHADKSPGSEAKLS